MSAKDTEVIYKHRLPVRVLHWINVVCLFLLLFSGFQIFNAHPALYWGKYADFARPALAMQAVPGSDGQLHGRLVIGSHRFDTTGVFGASNNMQGQRVPRGFPTWATVPGQRDLASGRRWHFFFAWLFAINGLIYWLWAWRSRHYRDDLATTRADWRGLGRSIIEHLRFKHPVGEEAKRYNILQKLAYLAVIFLLGPGVILMGLGMSPHMDSVLGWMLDLVGGRQSARTLHFIAAIAFVAFIGIHVFMVLVTGPVNQLRSMITGRYTIHTGKETTHDGQ